MPVDESRTKGAAGGITDRLIDDGGTGTEGPARSYWRQTSSDTGHDGVLDCRLAAQLAGHVEVDLG